MRKKFKRSVHPSFKKEIEEKNNKVLDFSDMPDEMKISAKLIDLVEPFNDGEMAYPLLYDCATIAWNECLKEDTGDKINYSLNNMLVNYGNYRELIDALKERKRILFPNDMRCVTKVGIYDTGDGEISINVASENDVGLLLKKLLMRMDEEEDEDEE